jgi:hypothetical protein
MTIMATKFNWWPQVTTTTTGNDTMEALGNHRSKKKGPRGRICWRRVSAGAYKKMLSYAATCMPSSLLITSSPLAERALLSLFPPPPPNCNRFHTLGGHCIYCSKASVGPNHLLECTRYKNEEESVWEEDGSFSVGSGSKPSSNTTAERLPVTPGETDQQQPHVHGENTDATTTEPQKVTPAAITRKRELGPSPSFSSPAKQAMLTDDVFVFRCLACAKRGFAYENGYAIFEEAVVGRS